MPFMSTRQTKRKWEERMKDIEELASQYQKKPLCSPYRPLLSKPWQPSSVWKLFHRQIQAFNFAKNCKEDVHVFALEKNAENKQRFYLVTTYTELWFYYNKHYETNLMHCYEVIPENAVCKLYFDLEFYIPTNPGADGQQMVAVLIEFICKKLEQHYGVKCSAEDVLNLDSSTEEKFSRHLIFQLHNSVFKNNIDIGNFLRASFQPAVLLTKNKDPLVPEEEVVSNVSQSYEAVGYLPSCLENQTVTKGLSQSWQLNSHRTQEKEISQQTENPDLSFLIVNGKHGEKQLFVDLGVYTKNRNFRLYKSSKAGKGVILDIAKDNKFVPESVENTSMEEQYFLSSLVCNVRFSSCLKMLSCDNPEKTKTESVCLGGSLSSSSTVPIGGYQSSPYPEIDNFVVSLVNKDNIQGGIRQWNYFSLEELLVYDISKYCWCRNIGRAHRSNNIMIVVDLKREIWYQKCHDPVCRAENFKSECFPLPSTICLPFLFKEDENYLYIMDRNGNIEEKANIHNSTGLPLTKYENIGQNQRTSSAGLDDELDDICFLEASEDVELADAVTDLHPQKSCVIDEIPDELLIDALRKHEVDDVQV
ncbi:DNA-directed primase/polymerase protein-like isoform X1 [Heteronotia binoei]|uniref:DNA-directed primase/polymerase protein-like isoform X1 n=2 Tax=Heteronotia binoei TaxID=13085 RepID=UPI00293156B7|nr:DNA-directed primase/polymerase protein-like isoform X1 [Heteronotia binoei]